MEMSVRINRNTEIIGAQSPAVLRAVGNLRRDMEKVFYETDRQGCRIVLEQKEMERECFSIGVTAEGIIVRAFDDLGFIYGLYAISKDVLGVSPFWFWNDQSFVQREEILLSEDYAVHSMPYRIKYRGWFVNDEVLIHTWMVDREKDKAWEMVFEALLRCGGNMVIPGTDANAKKYAPLAASLGLMITHHHAEPLGAEMFARAYPNLAASYDLYPEKFHALWEDAVARQKDRTVLWNIGFRGQGDRPFWDDDVRYQSDEARGALMGELIKRQYDIVKRANPEAVCCTNLYGETIDLYKKGCLKLPEDVIKIWAGNGYGKMVSRRQGNENPRVCALPENKEEANGIYYHVSFYDLQAANHMTMLPNTPEFVKRELTEVIARGGDDFWIINCSNVKPHVYYLDFIAQLWKTGTVDIEAHRTNYVKAYYGAEGSGQIAQCLKKYAQYAAAYGKHEDEHAGEQFTNHVARMLITQYLRDRNTRSEDLLWAADAETLKEQVLWYRNICQGAADSYALYLQKCEETQVGLFGSCRELFEDSILLQARIHYHCFRGALLVCESLLEGFAAQYQKAFFHAGKARKEYLTANEAMRAREHGKWHGFYENECLTDIKQTAWVLEGLMSYLRALGDGPHYYQWQREYLYSENDRRVMLIMNMENHLKDDELFALMEAKLDK